MADKPLRTILVDGAKYNLDWIRSKTGPDVRVDVKDVVVAEVSDDADLKDIKLPIIYVKRGGKFILLSGEARYYKKTGEGDVVVEGRLISSVAFKDARVPSPQELAAAVVPPPPPPQRYDNRFANTPRVSDNRPRYNGK